MFNKVIFENPRINLNFNLDLIENKKVFCFIGENGVGKTKLLETFYKTLLFSHPIFKNETDNSLQRKVIFQTYFDKKNSYTLPKKIILNEQTIKNENWNTAFLMSPATIINNKFDKNMVIGYISAKGRVNSSNISANGLKLIKSPIERFCENIVKNLNSIEHNKIVVEDLSNWIASRIISNSGLIIGGTQSYQDLLLMADILKKLEPEKLKNLRPNQNTLNIYINEGSVYFDGIPLESLSSGYSSIIIIIQQILDTLASWDLEKTYDYNRPGIFFIDELEAHLHPKWEAQFIPLLKETFPNITFFISTHSPVILSSTDQDEAYELIKDGIDITAKKLGNPKKWYLADIYSQVFHLDNFFEMRKDALEKTINEFECFSKLVKDYLGSKDTTIKTEIEKQYILLDKQLSENDSRKVTLTNLKQLVDKVI